MVLLTGVVTLLTLDQVVLWHWLNGEARSTITSPVLPTISPSSQQEMQHHILDIVSPQSCLINSCTYLDFSGSSSRGSSQSTMDDGHQVKREESEMWCRWNPHHLMSVIPATMEWLVWHGPIDKAVLGKILYEQMPFLIPTPLQCLLHALSMSLAWVRHPNNLQNNIKGKPKASSTTCEFIWEGERQRYAKCWWLKYDGRTSTAA